MTEPGGGELEQAIRRENRLTHIEAALEALPSTIAHEIRATEINLSGQLDRHVQVLTTGQSQTNEHLRVLNGRTGKSEQAIAQLREEKDVAHAKLREELMAQLNEMHEKSMKEEAFRAGAATAAVTRRQLAGAAVLVGFIISTVIPLVFLLWDRFSG